MSTIYSYIPLSTSTNPPPTRVHATPSSASDMTKSHHSGIIPDSHKHFHNKSNQHGNTNLFPTSTINQIRPQINISTTSTTKIVSHIYTEGPHDTTAHFIHECNIALNRAPLQYLRSINLTNVYPTSSNLNIPSTAIFTYLECAGPL